MADEPKPATDAEIEKWVAVSAHPPFARSVKARIDTEKAQAESWRILADRANARADNNWQACIKRDTRIAELEKELAAEQDECLSRIQERDKIMRAALGDKQPVKERTVERAVERIAALETDLGYHKAELLKLQNAARWMFASEGSDESAAISRRNLEALLPNGGAGR